MAIPSVFASLYCIASAWGTHDWIGRSRQAAATRAACDLGARRLGARQQRGLAQRKSGYVLDPDGQGALEYRSHRLRETDLAGDPTGRGAGRGGRRRAAVGQGGGVERSVFLGDARERPVVRRQLDWSDVR